MGLPAPVPPKPAPGTGSWLALVKGYLEDGVLMLALALTVAAFSLIAYAGLSKFDAARHAHPA